MTTQQETATQDYAPDYGSDGYDQYDAQDELVPPDEPSQEPAEETPQEPEAPLELPPDPIEEREKALQQREQQFLERQENQQLQGQLQGYAQQQMQIHAQQLTAQGFYPEQVETLARAMAQQDLEKAAYQIVHKRSLEKLVSLETGVPREQLKDLWDEAAMRQKAEQFKAMGGPDSKKVADLEQRLARAEAALKRNGVPAQNYNQPGNSNGAGSDAELIRRYAAGTINWSPRVQRALDRG